ncbi:MAG: hypothetical protein PHC75_09215 [Burkholderiales bacterium]|nr:hypothetical protein [Burkholderiales bacterium]
MAGVKGINLEEINNEFKKYLHQGYDLFFIHGWFNAYLSAPSDSEEDLLIPTYLILDEDRIADENKFSKIVDKLVTLYSQIADSIFENNKPLKPLINFAKPNSFDPITFGDEESKNLLMWLYGYLTCYLVTSGEAAEYVTDEKLLEEKLYPALFTLSVALVTLSKSVTIDFMNEEVKTDFLEIVDDVKSMWESEGNENLSVDEVFAQVEDKLDLADIVGALNDIFYVIRVSDENRFANTPNDNTLLGKLNARN